VFTLVAWFDWFIWSRPDGVHTYSNEPH